ncbi:MAG TPA: transposase [Oculatellaceae cyanobacterium]|jgi:putative transposase
MLTVTHQYKLIATKSQMATFDEWLRIARQVYNYALRERKDWVNSRKSAVNACSIVSEYIISPDVPRPNYANQCNNLALAKKSYPELNIPHSQVLQQTLKVLETAFVSMWERGHGNPRFKKKLYSFVFPSVKNAAVEPGRVKLPKIGWVKMKMSRPTPDGFQLRQIRIVKKASGYYAMLIYQLAVDIPDTPMQGYPLGVDIGLTQYLATSDGELIDRPKFFNALHGKLKSLQRRLKHKKKGSSNWLKLQNKIARVHEKISDTRKDWHFKLAHHLCDQAGAIFVEDINFKAWAKGLFGKHTLDAAYGQFFEILSYVCWKRGVYFAKVDKNHTSQTCPNCGVLTGKKSLSERVHKCPECRYQTHRDVAAAQVIKNRGVFAVGQSVSENASGGVLLGTGSNTRLDKC